MLKLKLPRLTDEPRPELPPELRWDAAPASAVLLLGRREFLKALVVVAAALAAPVTGVRRAWARARGQFFTADERATLEALCDRIIPPDEPPGTVPGAKELGAAAYIEGLLTAFSGGVPRIFAGGPFSNRNPFPDYKNGTASHRRPRNSFRHFIPLTRVQELRWRAEIYGSANVPGADFNDALLGGPLTGLRDVYRNGLARVNQIAMTAAGAPFAQLSTTQQDAVLPLLGARGAFPPDPRRPPFYSIVIQHTIEGCFSAPEYGGNQGGRGWQMLGLEGDDQPLGYSLFSKAKDGYNERPDHPMSTANPDEVVGGVVTPRPLGPEAQTIQTTIVETTTPFETLEC
jgi:hypothetical protein